jgi:isorenieratene synthase
MKVAPYYKILRVWFDKQLNSSAPDILETPEFPPINLIGQYHLLEKEFSEWANKTGGSVLEFHCYTWTSYFNRSVSDSEVWDLISPTVKDIFPEIFERNFKVLDYHVNSFENFASYEKGLLKYRPASNYLEKNGLLGIYLAGDWIKTDYPVALMEKAVSTGREAANHILLKDQVKQVPLLVVNKKGPGI